MHQAFSIAVPHSYFIRTMIKTEDADNSFATNVQTSEAVGIGEIVVPEFDCPVHGRVHKEHQQYYSRARR